MSTRTNIGKLRNAINDGVAAKRAMPSGPYVDPTTISARYGLSISDYGVTPTDPDGFIFGIHTWGSKTKKVTKKK